MTEKVRGFFPPQHLPVILYLTQAKRDQWKDGNVAVLMEMGLKLLKKKLHKVKKEKKKKKRDQHVASKLRPLNFAMAKKRYTHRRPNLHRGRRCRLHEGVT